MLSFGYFLVFPFRYINILTVALVVLQCRIILQVLKFEFYKHTYTRNWQLIQQTIFIHNVTKNCCHCTKNEVFY